MAMLVERLNEAIGKTTAQLLALHRLDPGDAVKINARVRENFAVRAPLDSAQAGLLGAVVSGAATGLTADLMAGGLTLGGGALLGAIVGALTMAGAAWGFNIGTDRERPTVQFADAFLRTLLRRRHAALSRRRALRPRPRQFRRRARRRRSGRPKWKRRCTGDGVRHARQLVARGARCARR